MQTPLNCWLSLAFACLVTSLPAAPGQVRVWETNEIIPTYLAAPPSPIPRFYSGRTYQGAKATFYPYPVQDQLTDIKTNKTYNMVYLENDYIKIGVLPEIGGRIFSAVDKSNGYNFFYRQHVIKPALIGMLGAWISGGVEWNIPHHHRASSFMPVEYTTVTNADGSATVWVGETELRHRMRWLVGMTLYPDRSYLELNCKVFNRTPFAHPMLFWINPAVHANTNYQVIFPPSTEWVVQHAKPEFASWPIARQVYGGTDYTRGVDISWWKNHPSPVSFFAWNYEDDWFGGYDHGKQAGVLHIADHNVAPGKKFFEWGNGPEGEMWSKVLTDDDGPYLELMAGAWSDNQPDYSWIQPGETREWQHWWYPIRDMGGVKAANKDLAMNVELIGGKVDIRLNSTRFLSDVSVICLAQEPQVKARDRWYDPWYRESDPLFKTNISLIPGQIWHSDLSALNWENYLNQLTNVSFQVLTAEEMAKRNPAARQPLLKYQVSSPKNTPMPKPVERPRNPKDYTSVDELYFTGQRIEQLYSPSFEAASYYQEILRRDPGDYRANTAMGILLCKQWRWEEAENYLRAGIARATANHIRPKDGEAFYYLGVALKAKIGYMEKNIASHLLAPAAECFGKAAWSVHWQGPSYYQLAEISGRCGNLSGALEWINRSLAVNQRNPKSLTLKSAILRNLKRFAEASVCSAEARAIDPLDFWPSLENGLAQMAFIAVEPEIPFIAVDPAKEARMLTTLPDKSYSMFTRLSGNAVMELIVDYANGGFSREAGVIAHESGCIDYPFIAPFDTFGRSTLIHGSRKPDLLFPFQFESIKVLETESKRNPFPQVLYYLGCLLYDNQPEQAINAWEIAERQASADQKQVHLKSLINRNLGLAYAQHQKDITKAIISLEDAVRQNPKEPRFLYELDVQNEAGGTDVKRRLEWLTKSPSVAAQRDDSLTRLILVYLADSQLDKALEILTTHRFHNWEGSSDIRNVYVDARLMRGQQHLRAKRAAEALKDFEAAQEFPANLEVGRPRRDAQAARIAYHIGLAHEALGSADKAKEFFTQASGGRGGGGASESAYYRALALQKVDRADDAKPIFENLVKQGQELQTTEPADYFAKFGEKRAERVRKADAHYLTGLGHLGLGKKAEADAEFKQALELHPAHLGALEVMKK